MKRTVLYENLLSEMREFVKNKSAPAALMKYCGNLPVRISWAMHWSQAARADMSTCAYGHVIMGGHGHVRIRVFYHGRTWAHAHIGILSCMYMPVGVCVFIL